MHMRIVSTYAHQQAEELLKGQYPGLLAEVMASVAAVIAEEAQTRVDHQNPQRLLYDRLILGKLFDRQFAQRGWTSARCSYYLTADKKMMQEIMGLPAAQQKEILIRQGVKEPLYRYGETDYKKERVTVEVQLGHHTRAVTDLYAKHALFVTAGMSIAGIEILATRKMQREMSPTATFFEAEAYLLMRHGAGDPPVPLLLLGVEP